MKKGFTLIEMLVVVLIVGILSSVALPQYRKVVDKSRFTKAQVMAKAIYNSCDRLLAEYGVESLSDLDADIRKISRLDVGNKEVLPPGFEVNDNDSSFSGAGFTYKIEGPCVVNIEKTEGSYQAKFVYDGTSFTCTNKDAEACAVYGLD